MDHASIDEAAVIMTVMKIVHDAKTTDPEDMETEARIIGAAISRQPKESIQQDSNAMEEDEHGIVHIRSSQSSPSTDTSSPSSSSSSSSPSSSSSSSSSGASQDTQELLEKLRSNQYLPLSNIKSKNLTKTDRPGDSLSDSASHQSSGQDSGSTSGHLPVASSGNIGAVLDDAGDGD
jgi:cytoskeletal protein RodZ